MYSRLVHHRHRIILENVPHRVSIAPAELAFIFADIYVRGIFSFRYARYPL